MNIDPADYFLRGIIFSALLTLYSQHAHSAPSAIGDVPTASANKCVWTWLSNTIINDVVVDVTYGNPSMGNRICKLDVANATVGNNSVTLALRDTTNMWGDSPSVPFTFVRPALPSSPANLRLAPL